MVAIVSPAQYEGLAKELSRKHPLVSHAIERQRAYSLTSATTNGTDSILFDPWPVWNETVTTSTTAAIWNVWADNTITTTTATTVPANAGTHGWRLGVDLGETPEQLALRQRQAAAAREDRLRVEGERALARQKAQALLEQHLDEPQREQLRDRGFFELTVHSKGGEQRRYRIHRGRHGYVRRLDERGREVRRYCIHPMIQCPDEDTMLTQKLWLENDEELFLRTANAS